MMQNYFIVTREQVVNIRMIVVGLNHRTASVEIREQFSLNEERLKDTLLMLNNVQGIAECVIVSTCNRMEMYAVLEETVLRGSELMHDFMARTFNIAKHQLRQHVYEWHNDDAIRHLFRVTSGLDSMIVGETQIIGQVRQALFTAQQYETTGIWFNTLFKQAITLAKRAHTETKINDSAVSISYAAVELGKRYFGQVKGKRAMIIGAGKMSELTLQYLMANGVSDVIIANRTLPSAAKIAEQVQGLHCMIDEIAQHISQVDIVISSTSSSEYVVSKQQVEAAGRSDQPLLLIDIAVPRDIDPRLAELSHVTLYDIDDLEGVIQSNYEQRKAAAVTIEAMIDEEMADYYRWYKQIGTGPLISQLQQKAAEIHEETMKSLLNRLPNLSEREKKVISQLSRSMLNQLLQTPIHNMKEMAIYREDEQLLNWFASLFSLEHDEGQDVDVLSQDEQHWMSSNNVIAR